MDGLWPCWSTANMKRSVLPLALISISSALVLGCADDSTNTENADEIGTDATSLGDGDGDPTAETGTSADTSTTEPTDATTDTATTDPTTDTATTDTATTDPTTDTATTDATTSTTDEGPFCQPGFSQCVDAGSYETCLGDGSAFGDPVACDPDSVCIAGACVSECEAVQANPSSVGCSFFATKMDNFYNNVNDPSKNDSLIAGNISSTDPVTAQLYFVPLNGNAEQVQGAAVMIPPEGSATFILSTPEIDSVSLLRQGGVYRLETSRPVVAYQHSPIGSTATNDASMLLPEHALTGNVIVTSYPGTVGPYPSYFTAIAIADGTSVDFTVPQATAGGVGVPALAAGASTNVMMNRYSVLNVVVQTQQGGDLSGTVISANNPLHVIGATECANVPNGSQTFCDHMEEAPFPLEYWGQEYVGAHAPTRGTEKYHWRVYGGDDGVTVNTTPAQPGFPIMLDKGQYYQFQAAAAPNHSFVFTGNGPFLPVQYLESQNPYAGTGDPGMYQMVPTEQFLDSYAFVTGTNYNVHYAQITRPNGGAEVFIDGNMVGGYYAVGNYQVADVVVSEGAHFATSNQPFGVVQVGYTPVTSYAYPGGLKLTVINPQ